MDNGRVPETLSQEVLTKMHAPAKPNYEIITPDKLASFDAFLLGIPTRYGNFPAQWKVRFFSSMIAMIILRQHTTLLLGIYRRHWQSLGVRRSMGQVRRSLYIDCGARRGPGVDRYRGDVDVRAPRHHLRAPRVRQGVWTAHQLG